MTTKHLIAGWVSGVLITACAYAQPGVWRTNGNAPSFPGDFIGTQGSSPLIFKTNGAERMRVDAGGNVGIGITQPLTGLHLGAGVGLRADDLAGTGYRILVADALGQVQHAGIEIAAGSMNKACAVTLATQELAPGVLGLCPAYPAFQVGSATTSLPVGQYNLEVLGETMLRGGVAAYHYNPVGTGTLELRTAGLPRLRIDPLGNAGLNVPAPALNPAVGFDIHNQPGNMVGMCVYLHNYNASSSYPGGAYAVKTIVEHPWDKGLGVHSTVTGTEIFAVSGLGLTTTPQVWISPQANVPYSSTYRLRVDVPDDLAMPDGIQVVDHHTGTSATGTITAAFKAELGYDEGKAFVAYNRSLGQEVFRVEGSGLVRCTEVRIRPAGTWPDYVFEPGYCLPTLAETAAFITAEGHLPGLPSAAEVQAEGADLGAVQAALLEKVEEMTLHLIRMQGELDRLAAENATLRAASSPENR